MAGYMHLYRNLVLDNLDGSRISGYGSVVCGSCGVGVLEVEEVLEVVEMKLKELMDEDEIRMNLKHYYMQDLLDAEKDKREGDADVTASAQYKKKEKDIQEGSNSQSATKPVRKSKRLRQEEPKPFRIYVKNTGRSEMIAKLQGKNFKFDAQGTSSTPNKAFDVSKSK
uniref:Uncharacterized protein n=1 Tax=Tanacetum cinerariifolium TaxID=118510 RepID=A0A6L2NY12_TANCI|nr:hypothetical protein [Tanacetum cinerariifolium]